MAGTAAVERPRPWAVFASGPFRKLWAATLLSLFGDFFSYIALAWLVLQLTRSSVALGTVLLVQSLPRAVLMAVGGALADRFSARVTMLGSMGLRAVSVGSLALLVISGHVQMWEVYAVSLAYGVVDAFYLPARGAILPRVVADRELEPGNAVLNVSAQAAVILGPVLGGLIVQGFGIGWAFAADAACFVVGALFIVALPILSSTGTQASQQPGLAGQISAGLRYAWSDVGLRVMLIFIAVVDFAATGAVNVGLPTLAHGRFASGASGLGILLGAWGVGATVGALGAGFVKPPKRFGWLLVFVAAWLGTCMVAVGLVPSLLPAAAFLAVAGLSTGSANTYGVSWLQRRTDPSMQGRVMSLVMLASVGLAPIGFAVSGAVAAVNPTLLFVIAGAMMLACAIGTAASRSARSLR